MLIKEFLNQGYKIHKEIIAIEKRLEQLNSMIYKVTVKYDRVNVQGGCNDKTDVINLIIDEQETAKEKIKAMIEITKQIEKSIEAVHNTEQRIVLRLRYINFYKWEQIAVETGYSYRYVLMLHHKGIKKIIL